LKHFRNLRLFVPVVTIVRDDIVVYFFLVLDRVNGQIQFGLLVSVYVVEENEELGQCVKEEDEELIV